MREKAVEGLKTNINVSLQFWRRMWRKKTRDENDRQGAKLKWASTGGALTETRNGNKMRGCRGTDCTLLGLQEEGRNPERETEQQQKSEAKGNKKNDKTELEEMKTTKEKKLCREGHTTPLKK